jgi:hypothetical protein
MSYYLYLVTSVGGRAGFGIAEDYRERNKHYASHSGDIVKFSYIYTGIRAKAKALERTIKRQYVDNIWMVDDWKTEWLVKDVSMAQLQAYVQDLIDSRHLGLELFAQDYDFTQGELDPLKYRVATV